MRHFPPADAAETPEGDQPPVDLAVRRCQTRAMLDLGRIHAVITRQTKALFAAEGLDHITPAQANVLMVLFEARAPLNARAIHRKLGVSEVTVSRLIGTLVKHGWVERSRDPQDARAMLIRPTEQARASLPRFIRVTNALLDVTFQGFGYDELRQLNGAVRRVTTNLDGD